MLLLVLAFQSFGTAVAAPRSADPADPGHGFRLVASDIEPTRAAIVPHSLETVAAVVDPRARYRLVVERGISTPAACGVWRVHEMAGARPVLRASLGNLPPA